MNYSVKNYWPYLKNFHTGVHILINVILDLTY